jgi:hypothetical protein
MNQKLGLFSLEVRKNRMEDYGRKRSRTEFYDVFIFF